MNIYRKYSPCYSVIAVAMIALLCVPCLSSAKPPDPVRTDPVVDPAHPPRMETLKIPSGDAKTNALLYLAGGAGRHPVVVMFHGYPGNEKNLDLAQAIRRAGFHVLWFNYRGSWGSGGTFSLAHALEDARHAIEFVRSKQAGEKYGFDAEHIAVVGHSLGGWLAFMIGAEDPRIGAVVGIAAWNPVIDVTKAEKDPKQRAAMIAGLDEFDADSGPLRGNSATGIYEEIVAHRVDYDYFRKAGALKTHPLLLIAASRDTDQPLPEYHDPLVTALILAQAPRVEVQIYDDDHPFSAHRLALAEKVTRWLTAALPRQ